MIEEDSRDGEHAVGLSEVDGDPVGVELGDAIGAARMKLGRLVLRNRFDFAEHLRGGSLIEADLRIDYADRFEDTGYAKCREFAGHDRLRERRGDERMRR